jgi:hypothetical protein
MPVRRRIAERSSTGDAKTFAGFDVQATMSASPSIRTWVTQLPGYSRMCRFAAGRLLAAPTPKHLYFIALTLRAAQTMHCLPSLKVRFSLPALASERALERLHGLVEARWIRL